MCWRTSRCEFVLFMEKASDWCVPQFVSAASVERMTKLAHDKGLMFMDATHFVHCSRTAMIKDKLSKGVIGVIQHVLCNFYAAASLPEDNIRFDPRLEPHGAIGDLGWLDKKNDND